MQKKLLPHLIFWPGCILIFLACLFAPSFHEESRRLGLLCIWVGVSGFYGFSPFPLTTRYADDFGRSPRYLFYVLAGILQILFRFRQLGFFLLVGAVTVLVGLFDRE